MGIKTEIGVEIYETAQFPTKMVNEDFKTRKILQYEVAEDLTAILLDNNEVYWCGSKLAYKPEK
jgi:alpha-tubulin suppressor-like RCC1 family protein